MIHASRITHASRASRYVVRAVLALSLAGAAAAEVPNLINFQGLLTDAEGMPDGVYEVEFRLWSAPQPGQGQLRWGHRYPVTVMDGRFNVVLGEATGSAIANTKSPHIEDAFSIPTLYLGLTVVRTPGSATDVANPQEINPRQRLLSAPYAMSSGDGNPVGTILPWYSTKADPPAGWVLCNGQTLNDPRSDLHEHTIPNLNGAQGGVKRFLRGTTQPAPPKGGTLPYGGSSETGGAVGVDLNAHYHLTTIFDYSRDQNPPAWPSAEWIHSGLSMDPLFGATRFGDEGVAYPARGWSYLNTHNQNYPNQPGQFLHHTSTAKGVNLNAHRHAFMPEHLEVRFIIRVR